jgi:hypothetical protein
MSLHDAEAPVFSAPEGARAKEATASEATASHVPNEEFKLFLEMRDRMQNGSRVEFKEDHEGELIAIESILHRASEYSDQ